MWLWELMEEVLEMCWENWVITSWAPSSLAVKWSGTCPGVWCTILTSSDLLGSGKKRHNHRSVWLIITQLDFPDSSVGKEPTCSAEDPSSIPGLGGSPGEGLGYPLQYSWISLVAQLVKNTPAMWETWVWSLGWEDLLEKGKTTHSSILAWRIPWTI